MPPFVHWPPSPSNSLEDDPLAVPDAGEVADGVEATAVCIAGPCDVDDPDKADVTDLQRQRAGHSLGCSTQGAAALDVGVRHVGPSVQTPRIITLLASAAQPILSSWQEHLWLTSFLS